MNKVIIDFDSSIYAIASACNGNKWEYKGQQWDTKAIAIKALESEGKDITKLIKTSNPEPWEAVKSTIDRYIDDLFESLNNPFNVLALVAGGSGNFRYDVATILPYKGNRVTELPYHFNAVKEYVVKTKEVKKVNPYWEVDDAVGYLYEDGDLIVSIDKDLNQIPGEHFNPKKKEYTDIQPLEASRYFYTQVLTGDSTDNILGIYGIGSSSTYVKQLKGLETEMEMFNHVFNIYQSRYGSYARQFMEENCRLLWLCRNHDFFPTPVWMETLMADIEFYTDPSIKDNILV